LQHKHTTACKYKRGIDLFHGTDIKTSEYELTSTLKRHGLVFIEMFLLNFFQTHLDRLYG